MKTGTATSADLIVIYVKARMYANSVLHLLSLWPGSVFASQYLDALGLTSVEEIYFSMGSDARTVDKAAKSVRG